MPMIGIPSRDGFSETVGIAMRRMHDFLEYLQLPSRREYWQAWRNVVRDVWMAAQSLNALSYLTLRPLVLLLWLVSQNVYNCLKFLFHHLFQGLWVSLWKGVEQAKWCSKRLVAWQYSLTSTQIKMELGALIILVLLFSLRRYIQKQGYVQRVSRWYQTKKRNAIKSYRAVLDRVSHTSLVLAMILPHALFVSVGITIKVLFPSIVTWLATETYAIYILSQLYPWIWTVAVLFQYRHASTAVDVNAKVQQTATDTATATRKPLKENLSTKPASSKSKMTAIPKPFPRTTPRTPKATSAPETPKTPVQRLLAAGRIESYSVEQEATYWLQYWTVYCLVTGSFRVIHLLPIVGSLASRVTMFQTTAAELHLFFYLWIYGMSSILTSTAMSEADMQRSYMIRPLPFLSKRLSPIVHKIFLTTSNLISPEAWAALVDKVKSFLSIAVAVRLLSQSSQTRLLLLLEYAHPFLVPAVTLLMPGFVTEYGVLYVNTIVPSAKVMPSKSLGQTMDSLQYWILHALLSSLLSWWSGLLWWIPFSTHAIFILWCHLQYTSATYYDILERELQAFGLLPKGKANVVPVDQTITATMFRTLTKSLPSAANHSGPNGDDDDDDKDNDDDGSSSGNEKGVEADEVEVQEKEVSALPEEGVMSVCAANQEPKKVRHDKSVDVDSKKDKETFANVGDKENPVRRSTRARVKKRDLQK